MTRSKLRQTLDLLDAIERYPNYAKTRLIDIANLNDRMAKSVLTILNHKGLINIQESATGYKSVFRITRKGQNWQKRVRAVVSEVFEEIP